MQPGSLSRRTVRVGLVVLGLVLALSVAELTSQRFSTFTGDHALISTFITEAVLLVGVYLVIDEIIQRRETRRWGDVMFLGIRALSTRAEEPAEVVRRTVDELAGAKSGSVDHRELVSERADELAGWLRADEGRARSFAEEMRRSASRLEEAIIRWGPTLVEDSESAGLLNLLPDIVDSARSAADTIAPATGSVDRAQWSDESEAAPTQAFEHSLREILENADEFRRRASLRAPS